MATARMPEDMTLRELSEVVLETNGREDQIAERQQKAIARETAAKIFALVSPPESAHYGPRHDLRTYPNHRSGCVTCGYGEDHPVHRSDA